MVENILSLFLERVEQYHNRPWLYARSSHVEKNYWQGLSWVEVAKRVNHLAQYLEQLNLGPQPKIAILAESRPEWLISLYAIWAMGGVPVPIMPTAANETMHFIINHAEVKVLIVSNRTLFAKVNCPYLRRHVKNIIGFAGDISQQVDNGSKFHYFSQIVQTSSHVAKVSLAERAAAILPNSLSAIIYTSGTSGQPRGVMLTHGAQLAVIDGLGELFRRIPQFKIGRESFLSFLPLSHCYEFNVVAVIAMNLGARIYFAESLDKLAQNMIEVKPTIMTAVPRLYQALRIKILARIEQKKTWQRKLLLKTVDLGMKKALLQPMKWWEQILNILFNITTRPQMKKIFGGHLKGFISGGAPLSPEVGAFISSFGVRVLQGYGMTEASIVVSVNLPFEERMETVGPPIKGVAVKIEKDGEIAVKGKVLMKGYWRDPKGTKEAFDSDGYLKTGDVGALVNGHLVIIDRKKDIIVNNGGENIAPQKIELLLQAQPVIKQAAVYGDHKPYITAVLVVEKEDMKKHGEAGLRKQLQMAIDMANKKLASFERVKKFIVTTDPFTIDNQQLSPTLKLRRHLVLQQYKSTLEKLYR